MESMRVLVVEDEPYLAEAIRDGLRLEAIAADIAGDGDTALELLGGNAYDLAVLDRDIPGPSGDEIARRLVASGSGMPILMLTAADRLDDKASGFGLGADDYLTKPFELRELVLRLRALDRRRAHHRPPVRELAGLRLDPFRREVYRDGRYVALTRKQFAVLEVLVAAEGGVVSAEELLARAWDENADPFTNAVRITVSGLRKRLGEPWLIATVAGVGYRIDTTPDTGHRGGEHLALGEGSGANGSLCLVGIGLDHLGRLPGWQGGEMELTTTARRIAGAYQPSHRYYRVGGGLVVIVGVLPIGSRSAITGSSRRSPFAGLVGVAGGAAAEGDHGPVDLAW
jgi:two-component system, OmpR family, response regulator VanR